MKDWIIRAIVDPESPEMKLLRQRMMYIGLLLIFVACAGVMPLYDGWVVEPWAAVIVIVAGAVLIVIDRIDTRLGIEKTTGLNGRVNVPPLAPPNIGGNKSAAAMVDADG